MFNPSNPNLKTFSLANIIEEQLSSISLGGSLHNLEAESNIVSVLEDRQTSDSESSVSLAEARRNSSGKDDASAPSQDVDKIVEALSCAEVRWFYKEPGNTKWTPFGGYDTLTIEGAYTKLPVELRGPKKSSPKSETPSPLKEEEPPKVEAESKASAPRVLVLGGLYELDFISRTCSSIYWPGIVRVGV
ncbi:hypothetical protein GE061_014969 [Apolygus lucorum]|uniref:Uncharacterized protein n=1 Tax=Apolygus lucorum TaxID=248454 RepID=A0A8S9XKW1_APOLU|nr:hypothetical protein GE061_014969 [Apolygus lucorum]